MPRALSTWVTRGATPETEVVISGQGSKASGHISLSGGAGPRQALAPPRPTPWAAPLSPGLQLLLGKDCWPHPHKVPAGTMPHGEAEARAPSNPSLGGA